MLSVINTIKKKYFLCGTGNKMEKIILEGSEEKPNIILDKESGIFKIYGRSIPHNPEKVYAPILAWFEEYLKDENDETIVKFELDYFNTSTQKYMADLFKLMNAKRDKSKNLKIQWRFAKDDEDMRLIGEQFQYFVDFKFDFVAI
jgi:hypothetical protein